MIKQKHHAIFVLPSGHDLVSFPSSQVSLNHPYLKKMKITLGMNKAVIVGAPLSRLIYSPAFKYTSSLPSLMLLRRQDF